MEICGLNFAMSVRLSGCVVYENNFFKSLRIKCKFVEWILSINSNDACIFMVK